jgi:hypothetical protein
MIFSFLQVNDCLAERYHGMPNRGIQRNAKEPAENFTFLLHSGRIQTGFYRQVQGQHRQQRQNNQNHNVHQHVGEASLATASTSPLIRLAPTGGVARPMASAETKMA